MNRTVVAIELPSAFFRSQENNHCSLALAVAAKANTFTGEISHNVCAMKKWPVKGCAICEDVSEVGTITPEANARSLP